MVFQEIHQGMGLAAGGAEVDVRNEHRAQALGVLRFVVVVHGVALVQVRQVRCEGVRSGAHQAPRKCLR